MFANVGEGSAYNTEFKCPWCGQDLFIQSWDTEYGDPLCGENDVNCTKCNKNITIHVSIEVSINTASIAGQPGYDESYEGRLEKEVKRGS